MPSNLQEKTLPDNVSKAITDVTNSTCVEAQGALYRSALDLINDLKDLTQKTEAYSKLLGALPKKSSLSADCQKLLEQAELELEVQKITTTSVNIHSSKDDLEIYLRRLKELSKNPSTKRKLAGYVARTETFIEFSEAKAEARAEARATAIKTAEDAKLAEAEADALVAGENLIDPAKSDSDTDSLGSSCTTGSKQEAPDQWEVEGEGEEAAEAAIAKFLDDFKEKPLKLVEAIKQIPALLNHTVSDKKLTGDIWGSINIAISSCYKVIQREVENELPKDARGLQDITDEMRLLQERVSESLDEFNAQEKSNNDSYIYIEADVYLENSLNLIGQKLQTVDTKIIELEEAQARAAEQRIAEAEAEAEAQAQAQAAKVDAQIAHEVARLEDFIPQVKAAEARAAIQTIGTGNSVDQADMEYLTTIADQNPELIPDIEASLRAVIPRMLEPREKQTLGNLVERVHQIIDAGPKKIKAKLTIHAAEAVQAPVIDLNSRAIDSSRMIALKKLIAEAKTLLSAETKDPKIVNSILDIRDRIVDAADGEPEAQELLDQLFERANTIMDDSITPTYQKPTTADRKAADDIQSRVAKAAITRELSEHNAKFLLENGIHNLGDLLRAEAKVASDNEADPTLIRDMAYASSKHSHAWLSRSRENQAIHNKAKIKLHQQADHAIADFINQLRDKSTTLPEIISNISVLLGPFFKSCPQLTGELNKAINFTVIRFCGDKSPFIVDIQGALDALEEVELAYRANAEEILAEALAAKVRAAKPTIAELRKILADRSESLANSESGPQVKVRARLAREAQTKLGEALAKLQADIEADIEAEARDKVLSERTAKTIRTVIQRKGDHSSSETIDILKKWFNPDLVDTVQSEKKARAANSNTGVSPQGSINHGIVPAQVEAAATGTETIHKPTIAMGLISVGLIIAAAATAAATAGILPLVFIIGAAIAANVTAIMAAKSLEEVTNETTTRLGNN